MRTLIDLVLSAAFCYILYRMGGTELNGKLIAIGFILWLLGYIEGLADRKEKEHG